MYEQFNNLRNGHMRGATFDDNLTLYKSELQRAVDIGSEKKCRPTREETRKAASVVNRDQSGRIKRTADMKYCESQGNITRFLSVHHGSRSPCPMPADHETEKRHVSDLPGGRRRGGERCGWGLCPGAGT